MSATQLCIPGLLLHQLSIAASQRGEMEGATLAAAMQLQLLVKATSAIRQSSIFFGGLIFKYVYLDTLLFFD